MPDSAKPFLVLVLIIFSRFANAAEVPVCGVRDVPIVSSGDSGYLEVLGLRFEQTHREVFARLRIRNISRNDLQGYVVQAELLSMDRAALAGFMAAVDFAVAAPLNYAALEPLGPLNAPVVGRSQEAPLARGGEREVDLAAHLLLPSCPVLARIAVYAVVDEKTRWVRVSPTILKHSARPFRFDSYSDEQRLLLATFSRYGNVVVRGNVGRDGKMILTEVWPDVKPAERQVLDHFFSKSKFAPAVGQEGSMEDKLAICFSFSKEDFHEPIKGVPARFLSVPILRVGVTPRNFSMMSPYY